MGNFVHLNVHTGYSLQNGACRILPLVKKAKELGQTALAITDSGALYGAVDFYDACKSEGIKAVIGAEVSVAEGSRLALRRGSDRAMNKLTLLCKNEAGYHSLCRLISRQSGASSQAFTDMECLEEHSEGLIAISDSVNSEIARLLAGGFAADAEKAAARLRGIYGEDFFLGMSSHGLIDEMRLCAKIRAFSEKTGIPAVPVNNVYYVEKSESAVQRILSCIGRGKRLSDADPEALPTEEYYLKSFSEMNDTFTEEELAVTEEIASRCGFEFEFGVTKLPLFTKEGVSDNAKYLREMCEKGALKRYGEISEEVRGRLDYELDVIGKMGFADYFLIVWDYVRFAKGQGIPVGPGRGSGAASLCAYCLGITDIDPLRYSLLFERFLNPERVSMPDFDIDFCTDRRDEVIEYVRQRYGADRVAQIVAFDTLKAKAAIRDAGRVMGIPLPVTDRAARVVSSFDTLSESLERGELKEMYSSDPEIKRLIDAALKIEGMPRHTTVHAAGVVITRELAEEYVPLQYEEGGFTAQYTMTALERLGLLKMDFLGLRNLTIIRRACDAVKKKLPEFDIGKIDETDAAVFEMLGNGGTCGVFQFESGGMTNMLTRLKPRSIEDLTAAIALYRPGPMSSIPTYIANRLKKPEEITYKHPLLKDILSVTYGCIVYQEQVMQICRAVGGYSYGRADIVRRAMSKKKHDVMEKERSAFVYGTENNCGAVANGVPEKIANDIFDEMSGFASYAFNKAHAAAYATVAYQTAYLRCHHYPEYMAALATAQPEKLPEYIADLAAHGTKLLPPDVNKSLAGFSVEGDAVRFGLAAVRNLGQNAALGIARERAENGEFKSASDLAVRMSGCELNHRGVEALISCGALDCFPQTRRELLENLDPLLGYAQRERDRVESGQFNLFDEEDSAAEFAFKKFEEYPKIRLLGMEREYLGAYISGHPADAYFDRAPEDCVFTSDIDGLDTGAQVSFMAMITRCNPHIDSKGNPMAFIGFEDRGGEAEGVIFSNLYISAGKPTVGEIYRISGKVNERGGRKSVAAADIVRADTLPVIRRRTLFLNFASENDTRIAAARELLAEYGGICGVKLCFADTRTVKAAEGQRGVRVNSALLAKLKSLLGAANVKFS